MSRNEVIQCVEFMSHHVLRDPSSALRLYQIDDSILMRRCQLLSLYSEVSQFFNVHNEHAKAASTRTLGDEVTPGSTFQRIAKDLQRLTVEYKRVKTKASVHDWKKLNKRWFYIDAELRYHAVVLHLKLSGVDGTGLDIAGARGAVECLFPRTAYSDHAAEDKFRADLLRYKGQAGFDSFGSNSARLARCRTRHLGKSKNDIETALEHYETHLAVSGQSEALSVLNTMKEVHSREHFLAQLRSFLRDAQALVFGLPVLSAAGKEGGGSGGDSDGGSVGVAGDGGRGAPRDLAGCGGVEDGIRGIFTSEEEYRAKRAEAAVEVREERQRQLPLPRQSFPRRSPGGHGDGEGLEEECAPLYRHGEEAQEENDEDMGQVPMRRQPRPPSHRTVQAVRNLHKRSQKLVHRVKRAGDPLVAAREQAAGAARRLVGASRGVPTRKHAAATRGGRRGTPEELEEEWDESQFFQRSADVVNPQVGVEKGGNCGRGGAGAGVGSVGGSGPSGSPSTPSRGSGVRLDDGAVAPDNVRFSPLLSKNNRAKHHPSRSGKSKAKHKAHRAMHSAGNRAENNGSDPRASGVKNGGEEDGARLAGNAGRVTTGEADDDVAFLRKRRKKRRRMVHENIAGGRAVIVSSAGARTRKRRRWTRDEVDALRRGIDEYRGTYALWAAIKKNETYGNVLEHRRPQDLKDKARNLGIAVAGRKTRTGK